MISACVWVAYLLLLLPQVHQLLLVLSVQPLQLLAVLLQVVLLPDQLRVVPPQSLQLFLQLRLFSQDATVQHAGKTETKTCLRMRSTIWRLKPLNNVHLWDKLLWLTLWAGTILGLRKKKKNQQTLTFAAALYKNKVLDERKERLSVWYLRTTDCTAVVRPLVQIKTTSSWQKVQFKYPQFYTMANRSRPSSQSSLVCLKCHSCDFNILHFIFIFTWVKLTL